MAEISGLRNVAIVGTHHSGKTTLMEAILAHCGAIGRRGSVLDGTTMTDYEPECVAHGESTTVGFAHAEHDGIAFTFVDCPGFIEFFEETKDILAGVDAAVVVLDGDPARVVQTQALLSQLDARRLPHLFVVNKLDRSGADFPGTLAQLQAAYGRHVVAEQWPIIASDNFIGYVDLGSECAYRFESGGETPIPIPEALGEQVRRARGALLEAMADFDDHLLEELLDGTPPPLDEVERDLRQECAHDQIVPVLGTSGSLGNGVRALVKAIATWFPAPTDVTVVDRDGRDVVPDPKAPIVARVIKTTLHPQSGKLSVVRIFSGTLRGDTPLVNTSVDHERVRSAGLYVLQGKKQEPIQEAGPGRIVAIARLDSVSTGDTLTSNGCSTQLEAPVRAEPVFALAVRPKERIDEAKISQMLSRIVDEDPALRLQRAELTNELLLLGSGEQHVTIAVERLTRKYKVDVETSAPMIPYQETITAATDIHSRYKHQTGGHGQFADVTLRFEPRGRGHGVSFEEKIVGGVVPRQFIPAVEKGVKEALLRGSIGGYPVTDIHVVLFDGAYHDVDSSEQAFKTAAGMAVREALPKCGPVVLEPIAYVRVEVPSIYTSAVIQQLTGKRGQILGMASANRAGHDIVEAHVPHVELARYITELRTATQGLGTYSWRHERYDIAPAHRPAHAAT
ncbi:MAG: elongation factor G [Vulcanimicrobiaceae bacterium]